jgi:radical SAM protein with 4Fe4S-binding SPASM domain
MVGNIFNRSLTEIFTNPYISEWEDLDIAFCKNCIHLTQCKGGCRAASEQIGDSLKCEDPLVRQLNVSPHIK